MSFANLSIMRKLGVGFSCVVVVVVLMSAVLYSTMKSLEMATTVNDKSYEVVDDIDRAIGANSDVSRTARGFVLSRNEQHQRFYDEALKRFADRIAEARHGAAGYPNILAAIDKVEVAGNTYRTEVSDVAIRLTRDNPTSQQAGDFVLQYGGKMEDFKKVAEDARERAANWSTEAHKDQDVSMNFARMVVLFGSLATAFLAVLVGWWLSRIIAGPVNAMTAAMNKLAAGDHTIAIPGLGRKDEMGAMAATVQTFKEAAIAKIARDDKDAGDVKTWHKMDEERAAREAEEVRQDQIAINGIAEGLARLSDGDLVYRIETPFSPKTEKLRADFNAPVESCSRQC
jgi:methyl-accepting chemotaxis protein